VAVDFPQLDHLTENLRALMKERGWSTWRLHRESGASQAVVAKLVRGERDNPTALTLIRLARALQVSVSYLLSDHRPGVGDEGVV
jgi:transcriptional regulator with XRE-family HTH domain